MSRWLRQIAQNPDDFSFVGDAILYFDSIYDDYRKKLDVKGKILINVGAEIPDLTEKIASIWSEIKSIYDIIELKKIAAIGKARKKYIEHYNRTLSASQVEKYAEVDPEVLSISEILIEIEFLRYKWEGLSKGVERLHQQLRIITEMRRGGLEEATI